MVMWLDSLRETSETRDAGRLAVALKEIVLDYSPSAHLPETRHRTLPSPRVLCVKQPSA